MAEGNIKRRLAAIVAIDVAGYSRLMGADEEGTLAILKAHRAVTDTISHHHGGRIVGTAGDGLLLEFPSVVEAVTFAVAVQAIMAERNADIPEDEKMLYRIGINLGDVLVDGEDIYGDGVNVAARLEGLADPGGVAVSSVVHDAVGHHFDADFEYMGEHVVKNIAKPIRAYRVLSDDETSEVQTRTHAANFNNPVRIIFASQLFQHVLEQAGAVAGTDATVLIEGESGVGKELIARHIHEQSRRHNGPFVKIDCGSIPPELFDSDFFGQSAGTLPGVTRDQPGRLETADRGTLFLDHVEDIPVEVQAKLLRPLQDTTFERLGDSRTRKANVRFIASTTRDLAGQVASGDLRRDLYFRLSVFPIRVPPLRARSEDIRVLVDYFLAEQAASRGTPVQQLSEAQFDHLQKYDWPGNVRELKNLVERALILSGDGPLQLENALPSTVLSFPARAPIPEEQTPARGYFSAAEFEELERNNLVAALEVGGWQISGPSGAAVALGISATKLRSRMKALNIEHPKPDSLYVRLGGSRGIATFTRELFGRAIAHPELGRFWKGRSTYGVLREEKLLVAYLSSVTGGPAHYVGRDMESAHQHLDIRLNDWEIFGTILKTTLEALSVPDAERREVTAFSESLKNAIVHG